METHTLISEREQRIGQYQNWEMPKLKPQSQIRQAQQKWLQEQNLMITQEELEALETYTLMLRKKLTLLKEMYQV